MQVLILLHLLRIPHTCIYIETSIQKKPQQDGQLQSKEYPI